MSVIQDLGKADIVSSVVAPPLKLDEQRIAERKKTSETYEDTAWIGLKSPYEQFMAQNNTTQGKLSAINAQKETSSKGSNALTNSLVSGLV